MKTDSASFISMKHTYYKLKNITINFENYFASLLSVVNGKKKEKNACCSLHPFVRGHVSILT